MKALFSSGEGHFPLRWIRGIRAIRRRTCLTTSGGHIGELSVRCLSTLNSGLDARQQPHIGSTPPSRVTLYPPINKPRTPPLKMELLPPEKRHPSVWAQKSPARRSSALAGGAEGGAVGGKDINRLTHLLSHRELT